MDRRNGIMRVWPENARFLSNISRLNHRNVRIGGFIVTICKQILNLQKLFAIYKRQVRVRGSGIELDLTVSSAL
jgi:hypothetical protein